MEEKFLYYLGAGASAKALPIVKDIPNSSTRGLSTAMNLMANDIREEKITSEFSGFLANLANSLDWLATESRNFTTVDTFAKYLYLKDRSKLEDLKVTLSLFFTIEQLHYKRLDDRYFIWLTSLLNRLIFPENIKILSWNYDFQLQLTAQNFQKETYNYSNGITSRHPPLISYYPFAGWSGHPDIEANETSMLHLNGAAGFYFDDRKKKYHNAFINRDFDSNQEFISQFVHNRNPMLEFAWEEGNYNKWKLDFACDMAENTTIMIVIGYSFPFFNRAIDKAVFNRLKESGKLKKIYFQDPNLDGSFLKNQFGLEHVEILHIPLVDSFYIPFEL